MIARSALPFSARSILERICQPAIAARLHHYARREEHPLAATLRRAGVWPSVLDRACCSEARSHNQTERFYRYCRDCEQDTAHEQFDELGLGWYAQICRCRRCGREGMSVWPLACW